MEKFLGYTRFDAFYCTQIHMALYSASERLWKWAHEKKRGREREKKKNKASVRGGGWGREEAKLLELVSVSAEK